MWRKRSAWTLLVRMSIHVAIIENIMEVSKKLKIELPFVHGKLFQLCPTLCDPTDCSLPGSSVRGILQARILEWVAMPFPRGSSWPMDWTQVSCSAGRFFTVWVTHMTQQLHAWIYVQRKWIHYLEEMPAFPCSLQHYSQLSRYEHNLNVCHLMTN